VQLQQVIINLVMNGIEAMQSVTDRSHELVIRSGQDETREVIVSVTDCGVGISAESAERLFNAFFTTKPGGMAWDSRSAVRSSKLTEVESRPRTTRPTVLRFSSPFRRLQTRHREVAHMHSR